MDVILYADRRGGQPVSDYIRAIAAAGDTSGAANFARTVGLLESLGPALGMPHSRIINRRERLYEMRFGDHRVAYIAHESEIVLLHGWRKRGQRLDAKEEATALRRADEWRTRSR